MAEKNPKTLKGLDAPAEVILVDPITLPIAKYVARYPIHPVTITAIAFLFRFAGGVLFATDSLVLGALLSIIGFYLDGIDGKVARTKHLDEELHGTLDFMLDQLAFGLMDIGAVIWAINNGHTLTAVLLVTWLALYMVFMSFTSTMYRIMFQQGVDSEAVKNSSSIGEKFFIDSEAKTQNALVGLLKKPAGAYFGLKRKVAKYRMSPYFGAIESEVAVFMIAPLLGFSNLWVTLAIIMLLPDTLFTTILNLVKVLDARKA